LNCSKTDLLPLVGNVGIQVCSKRSVVAEKIIEKRSCKMIIEKRIINMEEMPTSLAKTE
jgi:hypothetical protein